MTEVESHDGDRGIDYGRDQYLPGTRAERISSMLRKNPP